MEQIRFRLSEINYAIRTAVQRSFAESVWIIAEISQITNHRSGHCYLELIEKDRLSDKIVAKMRATIWSYVYSLINSHFFTATGQSLASGIKVMVRATVEFHELYGLSLNISDIDPSYTLGDLEKQRQEIIARLTAEGVFGMNKQNLMPLVIQRIAIISSETAAGYGDFIKHLDQNTYNYKFEHTLFSAIMQGDEAPISIIGALDEIFNQIEQFDAIVIIRGGGSKAELKCFDNYDLAYYITQMPIPVITGIGHDRDESIVDMVAHSRMKTPTAVADFILEKAIAFDSLLNRKMQEFSTIVKRRIAYEQKQLEGLNVLVVSTFHNSLHLNEIKLNNITQKVSYEVKNHLTNHTKKIEMLCYRLKTIELRFLSIQKQRLESVSQHLSKSTRNTFNIEKQKLDAYQNTFKMVVKQTLTLNNQKISKYEKLIQYLHPSNILKRGYSITLANGKILRNNHDVKIGDKLQTVLSEGIIWSEVTGLDGGTAIL